MVTAFFIGNGIAGPIIAMTKVMKSLADGDIKTNVPYGNRSDKIGSIAQAVLVFRANAIKDQNLESAIAEEANAIKKIQAKREVFVDEFRVSISGFIDDVASSCDDMGTVATELKDNPEQSSAQSNDALTVSERASANVHTVASAAEQLTSSITEIGRQVH